MSVLEFKFVFHYFSMPSYGVQAHLSDPLMKKSFTETGWRKDPRFQALCVALADCEAPDQVADFLRDVGTLSELQAWSERLEVATELSRGATYRSVAGSTGASTTTVTRVARFLENGSGYKKYLSSHHSHHSLPCGEKMASM